MSIYDKAPDPSDTTDSAPSKEVLWNDLRNLFAECGYSTEHARFFVQSICSPYNPRFERPYRVAVAGNLNGQRWEEPYRSRLMQCAAIYLRMSETDRKMLHAGAEDGVHWRGEPIRQFIDIVNETMHMRQIGVAEYRALTKKKLRDFVAGDAQKLRGAA